MKEKGKFTVRYFICERSTNRQIVISHIHCAAHCAHFERRMRNCDTCCEFIIPMKVICKLGLAKPLEIHIPFALISTFSSFCLRWGFRGRALFCDAPKALKWKRSLEEKSYSYDAVLLETSLENGNVNVMGKGLEPDCKIRDSGRAGQKLFILP